MEDVIEPFGLVAAEAGAAPSPLSVRGYITVLIGKSRSAAILITLSCSYFGITRSGLSLNKWVES